MTPDSLRASVSCTECKQLLGDVDALSRSELCGLVASLVVACHAAQPHCNHVLKASLPEVCGVEHELAIRCLNEACEMMPWLVTECPIELVGALTLVFHTAHEGHPIELRYGDRSWSSPTSKTCPASRRIT